MNREKERQKVGIYVSIGIHAVMLLVFFLMMAWTAPDPPIPEYGIEFSMGTEASTESANVSESVDQQESEIEEVSDDTEEMTSSSDDSSPLSAVEEQSSASTAIKSEEVVTDDIQSPDVREKVVEQVKKEDKNEKKVSVNDGKGKATEKVIDPGTSNSTQNDKADETKLDDRALYKKTSGTTEGKDSKSASLDMNGWLWDRKPTPNDRSTETGRVVFQITVDDVGEIISVKTLDKTVSPAVEKVYRDAVMNLTFSPTSDNRDIAPSSTGKITFIIQSK